MINADGAEPATALLPVISHQQASTTGSRDGKGGSDAGRSRQSTADNRQATSGCCRHICEAVMAARQACARCCRSLSLPLNGF